MRVTPTLVQAAEAVLRCALEPALAWRIEDSQMMYAGQASPCRTSTACATIVFYVGLIFKTRA